MGTGRHYSTDWQYTNQFVFIRCSQPEISPWIKLFGLTGDRFSELTDFAFEFVDFIAKLLEQFMHLRAGMGWPMFGMLMSFAKREPGASQALAAAGPGPALRVLSWLGLAAGDSRGRRLSPYARRKGG